MRERAACNSLHIQLVGVFVAPDHRRHGIGAALVRRAVDDATTLGVRRVYLYTPSTELFYSRLGWSLVERTRYQDGCRSDVL